MVVVVAVGARVSFLLNLYVHLEVASGSLPIYHSNAYRDQVQDILPKELEKRFLRLAEGYDFSLSMRHVASKAGKIDDIFSQVAGRENQWRKVLEKAAKLYLPFWRKEVEPSLQTLVRDSSPRFGRILEGTRLIAELTGRSWEMEEITILPVYALSDRFGFGSQPLGMDAVMIGVADLDLFTVAMLHEVTHLNLGDSIDLVARDYECEPDILTESVANMVTGTLIKRLHLKPPGGFHGPYTEEYKSFLAKFEEYNKLIQPLWSRYLEWKGAEDIADTLDRFLGKHLADLFHPMWPPSTETS